MKRVATRVIMVVVAHAIVLHVELHYVMVEEIVAMIAIMVVMKLHVIIIVIRHVLVG